MATAEDSTVTTSKPTHIDDVAGYLEACSDAFGQIAAILKTIEKEATGGSHLGKLAAAGLWVAGDFENLADCWHEEVKNCGVRMS